MTAIERAIDFLTREPVDGPLLGGIMAQRALPTSEAVRYAIEIGTALSRAHKFGLVHGAVSPFSVAITPGGARLLAPSGILAVRNEPYRAPEQVRREPIDERTDVWGFGALVYEMVTGCRAFPQSSAALPEAILHGEPEPLPEGAVAPGFLSLAAECLKKDAGQRRQRIQNVVSELRFLRQAERVRESSRRLHRRMVPPRSQGARKFLLDPGEQVPPLGLRSADPQRQRLASDSRPSLRIALVAIGGLLLIAAAVLAAMLLLRQRPASQVVRFDVSAPEHTTYPGRAVVSPDGRNLAFSAIGPEGRRMLWLRPLDALRSVPVANTEGASAPFWSADSKSLGFFADRTLKTVRPDGGGLKTVCKVEADPGGATWNQDGAILFAPSLGGGLFRVPADGGTPEAVLNPDPQRGQQAFLWPQFLPAGKAYLLFVVTDSSTSTGVYMGTLGSTELRFLFASETNAVYSGRSDSEPAKDGYLLFIQGTTLMARGFSPAGRLSDREPVVVAEDTAPLRSLSLAPVSVSNNATLVYQALGNPTRQLVWMDRRGSEVAWVKDPGMWGPPRIGPGGSAVVAKAPEQGRDAKLWLIDQHGEATVLTGPEAHAGSPVWSPDGSRIAFFLAGSQEGGYDIWTRSMPLGRLDSLFRNPHPKYPTDWSRDGRYLLFDTVAEGTQRDMWVYSFADRRASPVLETVRQEGSAVFSPDGRWIAFQSDQSGRSEVYIQAFPGHGSQTPRQWKLSTDGGGLPRWRSDGTEIYYTTQAGRLMAAAVRLGDEISFDPPRTLFQTRPVPKTWNLYDVSADGRRFLLNLPLEWSNSSSIRVATNWAGKLQP